jgi:hypothetical protein
MTRRVLQLAAEEKVSTAQAANRIADEVGRWGKRVRGARCASPGSVPFL